jgi:hypothetical protein
MQAGFGLARRRQMIKGKLETFSDRGIHTFHVTCGVTRATQRGGGTRRHAARMLRDEGWIYDRDVGWVSPGGQYHFRVCDRCGASKSVCCDGADYIYCPGCCTNNHDPHVPGRVYYPQG